MAFIWGGPSRLLVPICRAGLIGYAQTTGTSRRNPANQYRLSLPLMLSDPIYIYTVYRSVQSGCASFIGGINFSFPFFF